MAHALPPSPAQHRTWRLLGITCVVLGMLAGLVAVYALRQPGGRQAAHSLVSSSSGSSAGTYSTTSAPRAGTATSAPGADSAPPAPDSVPLVVANNTAAATLAGDAAARFEAKGWQVTSLTDFRGDIASTCAYYDPSQPNAERAAAALQRQFPAIKRVQPRFDGLPRAPVVVVLTNDWSP